MRRTAHWRPLRAAALLTLLALGALGCQTLVARRPPPSAFPTPMAIALERATSLARTASAGPSPGHTIPAPTRTPTPTTTVRPTSIPTRASARPTATATPTPVGTAELLGPDDGTTGRLLELRWRWGGELGDDEWFRLSIWPDSPKADARPFALVRETSVRITGAHLVPGRYRWQVTVVRATPGHVGDALPVSPPSQERTFVLERPSTVVTRPRGPGS